MEIDSARAALSSALGDDEQEVARAAALGLVRLDDPNAIPALINYLQRTQNAGEIIGNRLAQKCLAGLSHTAESRTPKEWRSWWRANRPAPNRRTQGSGTKNGAGQGQ